MIDPAFFTARAIVVEAVHARAVGKTRRPDLGKHPDVTAVVSKVLKTPVVGCADGAIEFQDHRGRVAEMPWQTVAINTLRTAHMMRDARCWTRYQLTFSRAIKVIRTYFAFLAVVIVPRVARAVCDFIATCWTHASIWTRDLCDVRPVSVDSSWAIKADWAKLTLSVVAVVVGGQTTGSGSILARRTRRARHTGRVDAARALGADVGFENGFTSAQEVMYRAEICCRGGGGAGNSCHAVFRL